MWNYRTGLKEYFEASKSKNSKHWKGFVNFYEKYALLF